MEIIWFSKTFLRSFFSIVRWYIKTLLLENKINHLGQWFSTFSRHPSLLETLLTHRILGPFPIVFDSVGLGWDLKIWISGKFTRNSDPGGVGHRNNSDLDPIVCYSHYCKPLYYAFFLSVGGADDLYLINRTPPQQYHESYNLADRKQTNSPVALRKQAAMLWLWTPCTEACKGDLQELKAAEQTNSHTSTRKQVLSTT